MEKTRTNKKKSGCAIFQGTMDRTVTMTELISQYNRLSRDAPTRTGYSNNGYDEVAGKSWFTVITQLTTLQLPVYLYL
jgi:hypothetical protein